MSVVRSSFPVGLVTLQNLTTAQSIPISACKLHDGHFSMYAGIVTNLSCEWCDAHVLTATLCTSIAAQINVFMHGRCLIRARCLVCKTEVTWLHVWPFKPCQAAVLNVHDLPCAEHRMTCPTHCANNVTYVN